ncbi:MAG: type IV pilus assembly protein PilM [Candidatus Omnitrophota bacterium]|nr:type IV pilus assembly protein PilM [Candidatus Omnitrophota bacterium]
MMAGAGNRLAVDMGSSLIKILQVSGPADKPVVTAIGSRKITGLSADAISDALKSLAAEARISSKDASISLSGPSVIVRFISLPKMDETALKGAIRYEAEKFIPYNISDCIVDFQTMRRDDKDNKLSILLVAAKKELVREKIKVMEGAGFSVRAVDVDCFAIANAFLKTRKSTDPGKSCAILNIGASYTNVSILKGDSIYFARDITVAGNDFTSAISKKMGLDMKAAEELKLAPPEEKMPGLADCIKGVFSDFLDEVKLSFGYYENQAGCGVDEVHLSGGASTIMGMEQAFEEAMGSKPIYWDPLGFMDTSAVNTAPGFTGKDRNYFSIASGLILR